MQAAIESLQLEVVFALCTRKTAQPGTVPHPDLHHGPGPLRAKCPLRTRSGGMNAEPRVRIFERLIDILQSELTPDVRKIGTFRSAASSRHMARRAASGPEEEPFARGDVARRLRIVGRRVE